MPVTPHKDKLEAAISNPKCSSADVKVLKEALGVYAKWIEQLGSLKSKGRPRVDKMVELLNWYKDTLEIELIIGKGSDFLKRQKGQLKLDSSVLEEFLVHLINPDILNGLDSIENLQIGPKTAFMSLAFSPKSLEDMTQRPNVFLKTKDQDFVIGSKIHYKFSTSQNFEREKTNVGDLVLAILAAECKVNLDKTMFQEAAGTAARLKQGCPISKYYLLIEYLDMTPEDSRLTAIDNVFLLRRTTRLPFEKRSVLEYVERQHKEHPIDSEVIWKFTQEIQRFIGSTWYDPNQALKRGSFI